MVIGVHQTPCYRNSLRVVPILTVLSVCTLPTEPNRLLGGGGGSLPLETTCWHWHFLNLTFDMGTQQDRLKSYILYQDQNFSKKYVYYTGSMLWNELIEDIRIIDDLIKFKKTMNDLYITIWDLRLIWWSIIIKIILYYFYSLYDLCALLISFHHQGYLLDFPCFC